MRVEARQITQSVLNATVKRGKKKAAKKWEYKRGKKKKNTTEVVVQEEKMRKLRPLYTKHTKKRRTYKRGS